MWAVLPAEGLGVCPLLHYLYSSPRKAVHCGIKISTAPNDGISHQESSGRDEKRGRGVGGGGAMLK